MWLKLLDNTKTKYDHTSDEQYCLNFNQWASNHWMRSMWPECNRGYENNVYIYIEKNDRTDNNDTAKCSKYLNFYDGYIKLRYTFSLGKRNHINIWWRIAIMNILTTLKDDSQPTKLSK